MTTSELLDRLRALDVHVHVEGGRLRVNAPKGTLTPELEAALVAGRQDLVRLFDRRVGPITAVPRGEAPLPLSFLQERLWVLHRLEPGLTTYNFGSLITPGVAVDAERLEGAIRRVIARHEILRSRFVLADDAPVVHVGLPDSTPVIVTDLRDRIEDERRLLLDGAAAGAVRVPFDLSREAPVRFQIFLTEPARVSLLISAHHIALDAWSFALLAREIQSEYEALAEGRPPAPPPVLQYADFAQWQRRTMEHPSAEARLAYWNSRLAGLPQFSVFPQDHPGGGGSNLGAAWDFTWPDELYAAVRDTARRLGATVYMVLLAGVAAVLHRHTGQSDLAIGSPLGTREQADLEGIIGPILNPIVLRFDLSDDPTFGQLIARAREALLEGHANQEVPFERVVQQVNPERSLRHSPLFQVAVVMHNAPDASGLPLTGGGAVYDLSLFARERGTTLAGSYEYRADLYEETTIRRIAGHVEHLLAAAVRDCNLRVSMLPLLADEEHSLVVAGFNGSEADVDRSTLVAQFDRIVQQHRDDVAVVASDGSLTYGALDRLSDSLAARLKACGARPGGFVALAVDRTSALPTAALGILKSGAAYVPIDLAYPPDRIAFMLRDSGARQIVTTRAMRSSLAAVGTTATLLAIDEPSEDGDGSGGNLPGDATTPLPTDIAYLIYTSGSTGTPKGVLVPHSAVSNFLGAMRRSVGFTPADVILSVTTPSFDISVLELFLPLVQGGRVAVADRESVTDGGRLARLIKSSGATMLQSTPSGWRLLMNAGWEGASGLCAIVGGEPMPPALAEWLRPRVRALWNAYGPTETTVWSTLALLGDGDPITIGTPVANTRIYVLDAHGTYAPIGAPGEICIAGAGVARGYHGRPDLTAERFVADPVEPGAVMYRTGDIGRWRADGRLDHLGRLDGQVKVRGYRIEIGEIEAALGTHEFVKEVVVGVQSASADDPRIVAWAQLHEDEECTGSELRRYLRQRLPEFMIPSMIVLMDAFPLTPNGKIDRRALPDAFATPGPRNEGALPSTPTEEAIAEIWKRLLSVDRVSVTDGFFDLGGHSLLAMRAANEITIKTGRVIDPRLLFFRTLGQLAEACDALPMAGGAIRV